MNSLRPSDFVGAESIRQVLPIELVVGNKWDSSGLSVGTTDVCVLFQ